jgi:hypothetical protein
MSVYRVDLLFKCCFVITKKKSMGFFSCGFNNIPFMDQMFLYQVIAQRL